MCKPVDNYYDALIDDVHAGRWLELINHIVHTSFEQCPVYSSTEITCCTKLMDLRL